MGLGPYKNTRECLLPLPICPLPCEDAASRQVSAIQEESPTGTWLCWHPDLGLPSPEPWNTNACYLSHTVYGILLQ